VFACPLSPSSEIPCVDTWTLKARVYAGSTVHLSTGGISKVGAAGTVGRMKTELDLLIEEIERGEWSNTAKPKKVPVESELEPTCWHCGGSGQCDCISP
jgi:hypothetical protein